jgi:uncharacterized protein involved in exopolysaccharide biosynthesis
MQYLIIIWKRLWLIILLIIVTEGVILSISYTAKPVYRATVRLQVLAADRPDVFLFSSSRATGTDIEIQQAQSDFMRILRSGFVAWKTIADLNLGLGAVDLLAGLSTSLEGDFIVVTVESDDPGRAEDIAKAQVENALKNYRDVRAKPSTVFFEFVDKLKASEQKKMLGAEAAMLEFKQRHSLDSIKQETQALQDLVRSLKVERERKVMDRDRSDSFARAYRNEEKKANTAADAINETTSPSTKQYYRDLARQHEANAIRYEAEREGYARNVATYDQEIQDLTTKLGEMLQLSTEHNALERELSRATNSYSFLRDKTNEASLKQLQAQELGSIQITEPPRKPDAPVPSKTLQLLLAGGAVSALVGFLLSFFLEFLGSLHKAAQKQRVF